MIIRDIADGMLLIPQTEHSQFVGQLAAHWGNQRGHPRFAVPKPFQSVVRAATYHDYGYLDWEPDVPFDPSTGRPYEFRKLPAGPRRLEAYKHCVRWITRIDPYSGLLVSLHRTGLWRNRYGAIEHPAMSGARRLGEDVDEFIAIAEAQQDEQRQSFDEDELEINFHLLQVWDLLGLYFGCQEPGEDRIHPVPTGYAEDSESVTMSMRNAGGGKVAFDPFPFDQRGVKVQMRARRVAARYEDEASFREAYYRAPIEVLEYQLV